MIVYKKYTPTWDILKMADAPWREQVKAEIDAIDAENKKLYTEARDKHNQLITLATELYGYNSNEVKYLRQHAIKEPATMKNTFIKLMREFDEARELERNRMRRQRENQRRRATVDRLEALGFKLNRDFSRSAALRFSKNVLVEEKPGVSRNLYDVLKKEYA